MTTTLMTANKCGASVNAHRNHKFHGGEGGGSWVRNYGKPLVAAATRGRSEATDEQTDKQMDITGGHHRWTIAAGT